MTFLLPFLIAGVPLLPNILSEYTTCKYLFHRDSFLCVESRVCSEWIYGDKVDNLVVGVCYVDGIVHGLLIGSVLFIIVLLIYR